MPSQHTLRIFDDDLHALSKEIATLSTQVREELRHALAALSQGDAEAAQAVIASDRHADLLLDKILMHAARTLARQQAMADDLRMILATSRMAMHLERIGDYAKNTAKRSLRLTQPIDSSIALRLTWMAKRIDSMLDRVIQAYDTLNADLANVAWADDSELDAVYAELFQHLLHTMTNQSHLVADGTQLLFIAKGLERAGDHVTDIAEEVFLMVTGTPLLGPRPKVDENG